MFYHIVVKMNEENKKTKYYAEYDLTDKSKVIKLFVAPYLSKNDFTVEGSFALKEKIDTLKIYCTRQSITNLLDQEITEYNRKKNHGYSSLYMAYPTKLRCAIHKSNDITREIFDEANLDVTNTELLELEPSVSSKMNRDNKKIFIVHGHDNGMKDSVALFITEIGLTPIILHQQANNGKTIIEKFEKNSDVGFAIVLYTPCDVGGKSGSEDQKPRARQNVVFEHGFFIGKLGREKVVALHRNNVEIPSDIQGMLYLSFDDNLWKYALAKEMKEVGFKIDMNDISH